LKMKMKRSMMLFTALIILSGGLVTFAAANLFTQTFPTQTFGTPLLSGCATLTSSVIVNSQSKGYEGTPTTIVYNCGTSAAFSMATGLTSLTVTPTFTQPSGWILGIDGSGGGGCATGVTNSGVTNLTSGQSITLASSSYDYCLFSASATNITSPFTISWTT
jgi:hypothetical protein